MLDGIQKLAAVEGQEFVVERVGGRDLEAGTYYFSEEDGSAQGQMLKNKKVTVEDEGTFYLSDTGRAYENVIINGYVYGNDGALVEDFGDGTTYEVVYLDEIADVLKDKKKNDLVKAVDDEGNRVQVVVNGNGKIKKTGYITIEGVKYKVNNYVAVED